MQHTPSFFMHLIRRVDNAVGFQLITPRTSRRWNDWLFATKNGHPYAVFQYGDALQFSVGRVRASHFEPWQYRVFLPYLAAKQQVFVTRSPDEVLDFVRRQAKNAA